MSLFGSSRRRTIAWLGAGAFVIYAALQALYSFNTDRYPLLTPRTTGDILVFTAMSVIVFLLLLMLLVLLIRNILKLFADQRSRALGSRLRTRMVLGAALIALGGNHHAGAGEASLAGRPLLARRGAGRQPRDRRQIGRAH